VWFLVPSMESASFLRELVAYYTLLESSSAVSLAAASEPPKDSYISLLSLDSHNDRASSVTGASGYCIPVDSHSFTNGLGSPCTLYGTMVIVFLFTVYLSFLVLHRESKKTRHLTLAHNFTEYWPIFKILSLLDSVGNL